MNKQDERAYVERVLGVDAYKVDTMRSFCTRATADSIRGVYSAFVATMPAEAKQISDNRSAQVGPGEMVFSYLFDNITIGCNQPMDLYLDGEPYAEVKALTTTSKYSGDVELAPGASTATANLLSGMKRLNEAHLSATGTPLSGWTGTSEIKGSLISKWRSTRIDEGGCALVFTTSGSILTEDGRTLTSFSNYDWAEVVKAHTSTKPFQSISFADIERGWQKDIERDYLQGKRFVLLDAGTLQYLHEGALSGEQVGLLRVTRGRPKVVIDTEKRKAT